MSLTTLNGVKKLSKASTCNCFKTSSTPTLHSSKAAIYTEIPNALAKHPIIRINGLYKLPEQGEIFIDRAAEVLKEVGIGLEFVLDENETIQGM
jgi:hypothetical protein